MNSSSYFNGRITIDPDICNGKPTLRGKRIAVQTVLGFLSEGDHHRRRNYRTLLRKPLKLSALRGQA